MEKQNIFAMIEQTARDESAKILTETRQVLLGVINRLKSAPNATEQEIGADLTLAMNKVIQAAKAVCPKCRGPWW